MAGFCRGARWIISIISRSFLAACYASVVESAVMLHLVGLGLADETDITVRGLEIVKKSERVYLEAYTSILLVDKAKLVIHFLFRVSKYAIFLWTINCYVCGMLIA